MSNNLVEPVEIPLGLNLERAEREDYGLRPLDPLEQPIAYTFALELLDVERNVLRTITLTIHQAAYMSTSTPLGPMGLDREATAYLVKLRDNIDKILGGRNG